MQNHHGRFVEIRFSFRVIVKIAFYYAIGAVQRLQTAVQTAVQDCYYVSEKKTYKRTQPSKLTIQNYTLAKPEINEKEQIKEYILGHVNNVMESVDFITTQIELCNSTISKKLLMLFGKMNESELRFAVIDPLVEMLCEVWKTNKFKVSFIKMHVQDKKITLIKTLNRR